MKLTYGCVLTAVAAAVFYVAGDGAINRSQGQTSVSDDQALQKAFNYIFTGSTQSDDNVEITDRNECVVKFGDTFYFRHMNPSTLNFEMKLDPLPNITPLPLYDLQHPPQPYAVWKIEGEKALNSDGLTRLTMRVVGDPTRTRNALGFVFSQCPYEGPKLPF